MKLVNAGKWIFGVESAVAEELPGRSVKAIGSRFGNHIDHAPQHATELRLIIVRVHLELLNVIKNRRHRISTGEAFLIVHLIQQEQIAAVGLTVDRWEGE